jgi:hypothetical protein
LRRHTGGSQARSVAPLYLDAPIRKDLTENPRRVRIRVHQKRTESHTHVMLSTSEPTDKLPWSFWALRKPDGDFGNLESEPRSRYVF